MTICPFHLAFPVRDLDDTRHFFVGALGCAVGRESEHWIDFDFRGHQITAHLAPDECSTAQRNNVDGKAVPVRHFGLVLPWSDWEALARTLNDSPQTEFFLEPQIRFAGEVGEQGTFFVEDPSGNMLEFKAFKHPERLFAS